MKKRDDSQPGAPGSVDFRPLQEAHEAEREDDPEDQRNRRWIAPVHALVRRRRGPGHRADQWFHQRRERRRAAGRDGTATQTDTGSVRTTVTNESGAFVLPNLPIGPYRLEATLSGFRTHAQTGIVLQVNSSVAVDVVLQLGELAETVQVEATVPLVETRATGVGQVMENERILELPLNGRQVTDLITLSGGAVSQGATRANNSTQMGGSPFIAVGGGCSSA